MSGDGKHCSRTLLKKRAVAISHLLSWLFCLAVFQGFSRTMLLSHTLPLHKTMHRWNNPAVKSMPRFAFPQGRARSVSEQSKIGEALKLRIAVFCLLQSYDAYYSGRLLEE
jgi:hypothetical protein